MMDLVQPNQHKLDIQFRLVDPSKLIFSLNFRVYVSHLCILLISALCFLRWCNPVQNNEIQFEFLFLHLRCSGLDSSSSIAGLHQCSLPVMEFCTKLFLPAPLISRLLFLLLWALWSFVYVSIKIHVISARWKQNSTLRPPFCVVSAKLLLWTLLLYRQSFPILIFALFCQQFPYNRCNFLQKKGERSTSCTSAKTASF